MCTFDETVRMSGKPASIIRAGGNIETTIVSDKTGMLIGKRRPDPYSDYECGFMAPHDFLGVTGDLLLSGGKYYLVMMMDPDELFGEVIGYSGLLYECSTTISIYSMNTVTKKHDHLVASDIHCLLTQVRAQDVNEDKATVVREYRGRVTPFQIFMQASAGLTREHVVVDASKRKFRVMKDFDPFIADGILQTQVMWEVS